MKTTPREAEERTRSDTSRTRSDTSRTRFEAWWNSRQHRFLDAPTPYGVARHTWQAATAAARERVEGLEAENHNSFKTIQALHQQESRLRQEIQDVYDSKVVVGGANARVAAMRERCVLKAAHYASEYEINAHESWEQQDEDAHAMWAAAAKAVREVQAAIRALDEKEGE